MRGTGMGAAVWIGGKRRTYCRALQSCTPYSVSNCTVYYVLQYCVRTVAHDTTAVLRCTAVSKALPQGEGGTARGRAMAHGHGQSSLEPCRTFVTEFWLEPLRST